MDCTWLPVERNRALGDGGSFIALNHAVVLGD